MSITLTKGVNKHSADSENPTLADYVFDTNQQFDVDGGSESSRGVVVSTQVKALMDMTNGKCRQVLVGFLLEPHRLSVVNGPARPSYIQKASLFLFQE